MLGELAWAGQHRYMPAGHHVDLETKSLIRDAALEGQREEPIVFGRKYARRHVGPRLERPGLAEHAAAGSTVVLRVLLRDLRGDGGEEDALEGVRAPVPHRAG